MARFFLLPLLLLVTLSAHAQQSFEAASIRPTDDHVPFERDGTTQVSHGTLRMHDVTVSTCIHWAYGVATAQIIGPQELTSEHYDILATAGHDATDAEMRRMMQKLLAERFHLALHPDKREMRGYVLTLASGGLKNSASMHPSEGEGEPVHQNSDHGFVAKHFTMKDLATYLASPMQGPVMDQTGVAGTYDISVDFRDYVDTGSTLHEERPSAFAVLNFALKGQLGLQLTAKKAAYDVLVVDHLEAASAN